MSEYQYYEFQAIDRPLDAKARADLRSITSRADITATSLINEYHWGDFKGNARKLMEQYFDAHIYFANWASYRLMLRLPLAALTMAEVAPYLTDQSHHFAAWDTKEHVILDFSMHEEGGYDDQQMGSPLAAILAVRNELMQGDRRPLYLGWLLDIQQAYPEDEDGVTEPPVPPGLKSLSGPQQALADFLRIDPDLIDAAAERSADLREADPAIEREQLAWLKALPAAEKDAYLLALLRGESPGMELQRRFRDARRQPADAGPDQPRRSAAELLARVAEVEAERKAEEQRTRQRQREAVERRQAEAREQRLASLQGREAALWREVETLVAMKQPAKYDEAVALLVDLRELAGRSGAQAEFLTRIVALRKRHAAKRSFLERLDKKGLH